MSEETKQGKTTEPETGENQVEDDALEQASGGSQYQPHGVPGGLLLPEDESKTDDSSPTSYTYDTAGNRLSKIDR